VNWTAAVASGFAVTSTVTSSLPKGTGSRSMSEHLETRTKWANMLIRIHKLHRNLCLSVRFLWEEKSELLHLLTKKKKIIYWNKKEPKCKFAHLIFEWNSTQSLTSQHIYVKSILIITSHLSLGDPSSLCLTSINLTLYIFLISPKTNTAPPPIPASFVCLS
jgi:hypothetical protein